MVRDKTLARKSQRKQHEHCSLFTLTLLITFLCSDRSKKYFISGFDVQRDDLPIL